MQAGGFEPAGKIISLGLLQQLKQIYAAGLNVVPLLALFKPSAFFAGHAIVKGIVVAHAKGLAQVQVENVIAGNAPQFGNALLLCSGKKHN